MTPSAEMKARLMQRHPLIVSEATDIRCGEGWEALIDALCECLQAATSQGAPQIEADQFKEKFGLLSFHGGRASSEQQGMIAMARATSGRICEQCGRPGETRVAAAVLTRCPEHMPAEAISIDEHARRTELREAERQARRAAR